MESAIGGSSWLLAWANPHKDARLVPTLLTGGPQPLHVAVGATGMDGSAEAVHGCAEGNVAIMLIDGVALPSKRKPDKGSGAYVRRSKHDERYV